MEESHETNVNGDTGVKKRPGKMEEVSEKRIDEQSLNKKGEDNEETKEKEEKKEETKPRRSRLLLPPWNGRDECLTYVTLFVLFTAYATYRLYLDSKEYRGSEVYEKEYGFRSGEVFTMIEEKQDVSHFLFEVFKVIFMLKLAPCLCLYIAVGRVVELFAWQHRKWYILTANMLGLAYLGGTFTLVQALATIFLFYAAMILTRSKIVLWIVLFSAITIFHSDRFQKWHMSFYSNAATYIVGYIGFKQIALRSLSFSLSSLGDSSKRPSITDMILYSIYLPTTIAGPLMNSNTFFQQFNAPKIPWNMRRVQEIVINLLRALMWVLLLEFLLHYLYITALNHDPEFIKSCSLWTMLGLVIWSGVKHQIVNTFIFGVASRAAAVDQIQTVAMPRCVVTIAFYSDMWRTFDRGLNLFNKEHIYSAAKGSKHGQAWNCFVVLLCFMFVGYVFGGGESEFMLWAISNAVEVILESVVCGYLRKPHVECKLKEMFSNATRRRIQGLLGAPCLAFSLVGIQTFFYDAQTSQIYLHRLLFQGSIMTYLVTALTLYLWVQMSLSVDVWLLFRQGKILSLWYDDIAEVDADHLHKPPAAERQGDDKKEK